MLGNKSRRLHEHAARAAGGIEDAAMIRLDHFGEQLDDAGRRIEFAATLPFAQRKRLTGASRDVSPRQRPLFLLQPGGI